MFRFFSLFRCMKAPTAVVWGLFLGVLLPSVLNLALDFKRQRIHEIQKFHSDHRRLLEMVTLGLRDPIWNVDPQSAQGVVEGIFSDERTRFVRVTFPDGEPFLIREVSTSPQADLESITNQVVRNGVVIGQVSLGFSNDQVLIRLQNTALRNFLTALFQLFLSAGVMFFLLRIKFLIPLKELCKQANKLSQKALTHPFIWRGTDEINQLGNALEYARNELKNSFATIEKKQKELETINAKLEDLVDKRTSQIQVILDNVQTGFLTVDKSLTVCEGCTKSCENLVGEGGLPGRHFSTILKMSTAQQLHFDSLLNQVFEDDFDSESLLHQLPHRLSVNEKFLSLQARCVKESKSNQVTHILFTLIDVTDLHRVESENQHTQSIIQILKQRDSFMAFIAESLSAIEQLRNLLAGHELAKLRLVLHNLRSMALTYGMIDVADYVQHMEDQPLLKGSHFDELISLFSSFLNTHYDILQMRLGEDSLRPLVTIPKSQLEQLRHETQSLETVLDLRLAVHSWLNSVELKAVSCLLGPVKNLVDELASKLGKSVTVNILGADLLVDPRKVLSIFQTVPHLLRNAVDHGIEPPWERGSKSEVGKISIACYQEPSGLSIEVSDDGRGWDETQLRNQALQMGLPQELTLEQLILTPGFSTARPHSTYSGKGLGLSAVRERVEAVGGRIHITSQRGLGFSVRISLPK